MPRPPVKFVAVAPDGERFEAEGITTFAKEHGLSPKSIYDVMDGRAQHHKFWKFYRESPKMQYGGKQKDSPASASSLISNLKAVPSGKEVSSSPVSETGSPQEPVGRSELEQKRAELRELLGLLSAQVRECLEDPKKAPAGWNPDKYLRVIAQEAKAYGLDLESLQDQRSDEEKLAASVEALVSQPASHWEITDDQIRLLEERLAQLSQMGVDYWTQRCEMAGGGDPKALKESCDQWIERLRRIKAIRDSVMKPLPESEPLPVRRRHDMLRTVRYMLYVGRSNMDNADDYGFFHIGPHLVKAACDVWEAKHQAEWDSTGCWLPGELKLDGTTSEGIKYDGAMLLMPPRHTKTTYLKFEVGERLSENPRTQGAYLHARDEEAEDFLKNVSLLFKRDNASGRRNLSLYPDLALSGRDNTTSQIRLLCDDPPKNPQLKASGIWGSALGNDLDFIIADDVVPQEDASSPTERARRKEKFRGTWLTRFQGSKGFYILSGYFWHHDDLMHEYYGLAKKAAETGGRKGVRLRVSKQPVGGPNDKPAFFSIWPSMYPPNVLRRRFMGMADPNIWAANYCLNPITDEMRLVRCVRWYDPADDPLEEQRFLASATIHLSVDPAATARTDSDSAGLVMLAVGDAQVSTVDPYGIETIQTEEVAKVIHAEEFKATQSDLAARIAAVAEMRKIDVVHVETVGGYVAVAEMLRNKYGITTIVEHGVGNKNKEQRLRAVATMLDDSTAIIHAKVMFPGRKEDGRWVSSNDDMRKLVDYIVNFRVTSGHHTLDALTQCLKHIAPQIGIGEGSVSEEVQWHRAKEQNRMQRMLAQMRQQERRQENAVGMMDFAAGGFM